MATPPTLVLGDDGTPGCDVAWLWVNNHSWPGWRLEVVTAEPPEAFRVRPAAQTALQPWRPPHPRDPFATAQFDEVVHLHAETDPRLALSRAADLLVIGPRGPGLLKSMHLGSTADWLLLHPPAPLVIVRHGHTVREVVLCTDGSASAEAATAALCHLPWIDRLVVTVLAIDDHRVDIGAATTSAADRLTAAGARVDICTMSGKPTPVILEQLERAKPDLTVLGTRGLTGLPRLRVGSTAATVTRAAACSVLVACAADTDLDSA